MTGPTVETRIWMALRSRLITEPLGTPKAWPGEIYRPAAGTAFLRVGTVTTAPVRQLVAPGQRQLRTGSLIATWVSPLVVGQAGEVAKEQAGRIAAHFPDGTQLHYAGVCVEVVDYPLVGDGFEDGGWWNIPVRINWRCFA